MPPNSKTVSVAGSYTIPNWLGLRGGGGFLRLRRLSKKQALEPKKADEAFGEIGTLLEGAFHTFLLDQWWTRCSHPRMSIRAHAAARHVARDHRETAASIIRLPPVIWRSSICQGGLSTNYAILLRIKGRMTATRIRTMAKVQTMVA